MSDPSDRIEAAPFHKRFLDLACAFQAQLFYLLVIESVLLVLVLFSLSFIERGSSSYVILLVDVAFIAVTIVPVGLLIYVCSHRYY